MYISLAWAFKDDDSGSAPVKDMSQWRKRLSKGEFLKLAKPARERYIKLYPHSSHRFLMGGDSKEKADDFNGAFVPKMPNKKNEVVVHGGDRFPSTKEVHAKRMEVAKVRRDIADYNKANVAVINPQSLSALNQVKDDHLREASDTIKKNKTEIATVVQQQATKQPVMYRKGLDAVKSLMNGDKKPDEMKTTEKHAMQKVLAGVATMALFGAGIMACSMAAAPLGVLVGKVMFDMWAGSKHGKNLRDDIDELRQAREKKRLRERKEAAAAAGVKPEDLDEDGDDHDSFMDDAKSGKFRVSSAERKRHTDIKQRIANGDKNITPEDKDFLKDVNGRDSKMRHAAEMHRKSGYKAAASSFDGDDDHSDTINLIVDQVSDILQYHSARDFQVSRDEMFASASDNALESLRYLLNLAQCENYEKCGDGVVFDCHGGITALQKLFTGMEFMPSTTSDGERTVYHFETDNAQASIGAVDNRYYIRYDGDFDYSTD
jgi:hypothetical protein